MVRTKPKQTKSFTDLRYYKLEKITLQTTLKFVPVGVYEEKEVKDSVFLTQT